MLAFCSHVIDKLTISIACFIIITLEIKYINSIANKYKSIIWVKILKL